MDSKEPDHTFSAADRIRQLNEIDQDVAKLLHAAGLAVQALTNAPLPTDNPSQTASSSSEKNVLDAHKDAFKEASSQYFSLLSSIDVRLRRQVYALEEASIIRPESAVKAGEGVGIGAVPPAPGSTNPLEISWLNTRKDTVEKEKEALLWADAREFVLELKSKTTDGGPKPQSNDNLPKEMDVD
ncbi:hypothetical protein LOZ65_002726 [Ophidiomyces ophidiicola]|nr:hypothetical protein LOZ65_002726 [Ophidiomyces ophidiicola]